MAQIAASIGKSGFNNPVPVDADKRIVAGHGRVEAAKRLGFTSIPKIRLNRLSDARAPCVCNRRQSAGRVGCTGFDAAELDDDTLDATKPVPADEFRRSPRALDHAAISGLWGEHRLCVVMPKMEELVQRLMAQETARMVFNHLPYKVTIDGHVGGAGKIMHREFAMASRESMADATAERIREKIAASKKKASERAVCCR
jgi:hypothetical protein